MSLKWFFLIDWMPLLLMDGWVSSPGGRWWNSGLGSRYRPLKSPQRAFTECFPIRETRPWVIWQQFFPPSSTSSWLKFTRTPSASLKTLAAWVLCVWSSCSVLFIPGRLAKEQDVAVQTKSLSLVPSSSQVIVIAHAAGGLPFYIQTLKGPRRVSILWISCSGMYFPIRWWIILRWNTSQLIRGWTRSSWRPRLEPHIPCPQPSSCQRP